MSDWVVIPGGAVAASAPVMNTWKEYGGATVPVPGGALAAEFGIIGALSGAALGGMAGPPGAASGAIIGGVIGVLCSLAYQAKAAQRDAHDARLDADLGISEGEIGAPNLPHWPARIGAFSIAASGAGLSQDQAPAEGPFTLPE